MYLLKYAVPIAIIVFVISNMYLANSQPDVSADNRLYLSIGAAILSGSISLVLFRKEPDEQPDPHKKGDN
ncbi:hypothetical protein ACFOZY_15490 [Chungangia koreensis]|uniref:Histidine kinase n=1 Tax=Chungangia koreensis TaxID=752657 RepID=A0ABV8X9B2_9LACT